MRAAPRTALLLLAGWLAAGCATAPRRGPTDGERLAALVDRYWEELLALEPIRATAVGDDRHNAELPNDLSADHRARRKAHAARTLAALAAIDRARLAPPERLSYDVLEHELVDTLDGLRFPGWLLPIHPFGSAPTRLAVLASGRGVQPFRSVKDYEDFLGRLDAAAPLLDQAVENMREGIAVGVVQPRLIMEKVLVQLDALVLEPPERSVFWGAVATMPADLPEADRERLAEAYRTAIAERVVPAYRRLRDFVRDEYLPHCRETVGLWALPDGRAWYAFLVRAATTTGLTPEEIHAIGLQEVSRIRAEMDGVRRAVGFEGDLAAFLRHLRDDPRSYFARAEDLLASQRALLRRVDASLPRVFDLFPRADCEIREADALRAEIVPGAQYVPGTPDGRRPGVLWVDTRDLRALPRFGMESLSLHEASPGHHFQRSIAQEAAGLPAFRRFGGNVAYQEGWAEYAESVGKELGLFTDPLPWFGHLADELLRALRLVVDSGIHAKGWSQEQAVRYMLENSSLAERDAVAEVERVIAVPGRALAYKVGQIAIAALRQEAEASLGSRFDARAFHRQVLGDGALPLDVLGAKVREWIAAERTRPPRSPRVAGSRPESSRGTIPPWPPAGS